MRPSPYMPPSSPSTYPSRPDDCHLKQERSIYEGESFRSSDPFADARRSSTLSFDNTLPGTPNNETYLSEKHHSIDSLKKQDPDYAANRVKELGALNVQVDEKPDYDDPDGMKQRRAKRLMKVRKFGFQCLIFGFKYVQRLASFLRSN